MVKRHFSCVGFSFLTNSPEPLARLAVVYAEAAANLMWTATRGCTGSSGNRPAGFGSLSSVSVTVLSSLASGDLLSADEQGGGGGVVPRKERKGKDALLQGCPNVLSILVKLVAPSSLWGKALQIGQKACHYFVLTVLTRRSRWDPDSHSFPNFMITMVDLLFCDLPFNILMGKCLILFFF